MVVRSGGASCFRTLTAGVARLPLLGARYAVPPSVGGTIPTASAFAINGIQDDWSDVDRFVVIHHRLVELLDDGLGLGRIDRVAVEPHHQANTAGIGVGFHLVHNLAVDVVVDL